MAVIDELRELSGAGVLAPIKGASPLTFRRLNLIYGFNGSGKSTLARIMSSLENGRPADGLPAGVSFEFGLEGGRRLGTRTGLSGLESQISVFNSAFVTANLRWDTADATPVFYIGSDQADAAERLKKKLEEMPGIDSAYAAAPGTLEAAEKQFADFKRTRAAKVVQALQIVGRRYDARDFAHDVAETTSKSELNADQLAGAIAMGRRGEPLPTLALLAAGLRDRALQIRQRTLELAAKSVASGALQELSDHPTMAGWLKTGHDYHRQHELSRCLYCGSGLEGRRIALLSAALDNELSRQIEELEELRQEAVQLWSDLAKLFGGVNTPPDTDLVEDLRSHYNANRETLVARVVLGQRAMSAIMGVIATKQASPAQAITSDELPTPEHMDAVFYEIDQAVGLINTSIADHNALSATFLQHRAQAQLAVRGHYAAQAKSEYDILESSRDAAKECVTEAESARAALRDEVERLRAEVRRHGPAADKINTLVRSYLGHGELSVFAEETGFKIHRHGDPIQGAPSEGEKTAIALCYFISSLEKDGRNIREQIIVIDDPISSLDTRAMNFSCALIKGRLANALQLFVLTHNLHFMNEFKKTWRRKAKPDDGRDPTATLLFLDVTMATDGRRSSRITELPRLLEHYDFEYHYLVDHVFKFEAQGTNYAYAYMMPHVLRRVLEVFIAFKCPGLDVPTGVTTLGTRHQELGPEDLKNLERLAQLESHSDSVENLVQLSPLTVEESMRANATLIALMHTADAAHEQGLRRLCRN